MSDLKPFALSPKVLRDIWADQMEFNRNFRDMPAPTFEQRTAETKELVLHLMSECDELLRASGAWKPHRRTPVRENRRHVLMEMADIFKYLISVAQVHGVTEDEFVDAYWEKSMVVRQRYAQEFMCALDHPAIIVDLDNVLVDYIAGFLEWMWRNKFITQERADTLLVNHTYCNAESLGMLPHLYDEVKHLFRVSGEHALLPAMAGAHEFIAWLNKRSELTVVLTARPIDRYPNLYGETLQWMKLYDMRADMVWWASDKGEALRTSGIADHVTFAVDDEWKYVEQYQKSGVRCYWLFAQPDDRWASELTSRVASLEEIISIETEETE